MIVESLIYRLVEPQCVTYKSAPPVRFATEHAELALANGELRATMKASVSDVAEARALVEPVLRAWECRARLLDRNEDIRFQYERASVRHEDLDGGIRIGLTGIESRLEFGVPSLHFTNYRYPDPPLHFRVTPDAEMLANRFANVVEGREPLPSAAYACLTFIEGLFRGLPRASAELNMSMNVLETLSRLASRKGDAATARKLNQPLEPLSGREQEWMRATLRELIFRLGDARRGSDLPELTLAELPALG